MRTREQLQEENTRLRAAVRSVTPNVVIRELAEAIRAEAIRSPLPEWRNGMLQAAAMLDGGARDD
jgi:rRNA-processing protein FCF1